MYIKMLWEMTPGEKEEYYKKQEKRNRLDTLYFARCAEKYEQDRVEQLRLRKERLDREQAEWRSARIRAWILYRIPLFVGAILWDLTVI